MSTRYVLTILLMALASGCSSQRTIATPQQKDLEVYSSIPASFDNSRWQFVDIKGNGVASGKLAPYVRFAQGELSGFTGCNAFFGRYQRDGMWLNISAFKAEKQPCDSLSVQQKSVIGALMQMRSIRIIQSSDNLVFMDAQSKVVAELKSVKVLKEGS